MTAMASVPAVTAIIVRTVSTVNVTCVIIYTKIKLLETKTIIKTKL